MEKKIKAMGFPKLQGSPFPMIDATAKGVVKVSSEGQRLHEAYITIGAPTGDGHFEIAYSPSDKSILLKLSGTFDCAMSDKEKQLKSAKCLIIRDCTLQDAKGKDIKGPKDESDYASPLRASVTGLSRELFSNDVYQVPVKIKLERI
jgi:hypothetical protein